MDKETILAKTLFHLILATGIFTINCHGLERYYLCLFLSLLFPEESTGMQKHILTLLLPQQQSRTLVLVP